MQSHGYQHGVADEIICAGGRLSVSPSSDGHAGSNYLLAPAEAATRSALASAWTSRNAVRKSGEILAAGCTAISS